MTRKEYLEYIEECLKKSGLSKSAFGKLVAGDPSLISRLRNGQESRESTQQSVIEKAQRLCAENQG